LDKGEAAERVAWAGAGLRLPAPARCSVERLRDGALRLLADPRYASRAVQVGRALARLGGAPRAAELLEGLSGQGRANVD